MMLLLLPGNCPIVQLVRPLPALPPATSGPIKQRESEQESVNVCCQSTVWLSYQTPHCSGECRCVCRLRTRI